MKKWYVITGILALLLVISLGTCSGQSSRVSELEVELESIGAELESARSELESMGAVLVREINFDNGLRVFDINKAYGGVDGRVQNTSEVPMERVQVIVAFYDENGSLVSLGTPIVHDLYPNEEGKWTAFYGGGYGVEWIFDVYAIGNRED